MLAALLQPPSPPFALRPPAPPSLNTTTYAYCKYLILVDHCSGVCLQQRCHYVKCCSTSSHELHHMNCILWCRLSSHHWRACCLKFQQCLIIIFEQLNVCCHCYTPSHPSSRCIIPELIQLQLHPISFKPSCQLTQLCLLSMHPVH